MTTYAATVLADSPLAYWRLGDGLTFVAADSSGNSRDSSYGTTSGGAAGLLIGDADGCRDSVGCTIADAAWMNVNSISLELWVNLNAANFNKGLFSRFNTGGGQDWLIWMNVTGTGKIGVRFINAAGSQVNLEWSTTPTPGTTYHVVATYTSGSAILYINGVAVDTQTSLTGNLRQSACAIDVGTYSSGGTFGANSKFDEAAIYDGVLSPTRVLAHYNAGINPTTVIEGTASATFGFTATVAGASVTLGSASGSFALTGTAQGVPTTHSVVGGTFTFTGAASGFRSTGSSASALFSFNGSVEGHRTGFGAASAAFAFVATANGDVVFYDFIPPGYEEPVRVEGNLFVKAPRTMSVIRVSGELALVKSPFVSQLVGDEGVDWFLGGRIYTVSAAVAAELVAAGYTVTNHEFVVV